MNGEAFQSKKPGGVTLTEDISQVIKKIGKRGIYHLTYFNIDIPWDTSMGRRQGIFLLESISYNFLKILNIENFEL